MNRRGAENTQKTVILHRDGSSRHRAIDPYKQGDDMVTGHHIIPHSLLIWALEQFDAADRLLIQEQFIPKPENLTLLNLHRTGVFKIDKNNTTGNSGIVNAYISSLNPHTRQVILNIPTGTFLPQDVKTALNQILTADDELRKQDKNYRQSLAASYFEWQRYNVFYGPAKRHDPGKKNEFDTDGKYFLDSQTYESLHEVYKKLLKAKKYKKQVNIPKDVALLVEVALMMLKEIHTLYTQGKITPNTYEIKQWVEKTTKGKKAFVPKARFVVAL